MHQHCVIARFDKAADEKLDRLKKGVSEIHTFDGTKGWPPHITLGCYENVDAAQLCGWTKDFAQRHEPFMFHFSSLGIFCDKEKSPDTDVIYAVPTAPKKLTELYYGFHEQFDDFSGAIGWNYSMVFGQPALHASITICKTSEFDEIFKYLYRSFRPFTAMVTALEVYELPMKLLERYELKGPTQGSVPTGRE